MICRTCLRPLSAPFRSWGQGGSIVSGCVAADHDGHLVGISESNRWHNRPEARKIRRDEVRRLRALLAVRS